MRLGLLWGRYFLHRANQCDVVCCGDGIEVVESLFRFLEDLAGAVRIVHQEFVPFLAIVCHSVLLFHVCQRDDVCDTVLVEPHHSIPWDVTDEVGGGASSLS
jgi:hypothetical protein